jgi:phage gpG-like protein
MTMTIKMTVNKLGDIRKAMKALTDKDVLIGIPEDQAAREAAGESGISNAYLGYIHEYGVPSKNIPARPFLHPGIERARKDIADAPERTAKKALQGNPGAVEAGLNKVGLIGQNSVRAAFVDNDWPPLSDKTLDYNPLSKDEDGKVRTTKKGKPKRKKSRREKGNINPLIDTGQLRKSITYVIR